MNFSTKEEKQEALKKVLSESEIPPADVEDIDQWQESVDAKIAEIESAEIGEVASEGSQVPAEESQVSVEAPPNESTEQNQQVDDDVLTFNVKRSELPEALRQYKDVPNILKQAEHARVYANKSEERLRQTQQQMSSYASEIETLRNRLDELQNASKKSQQMSNTQGSVESQQQIDDLNTKLSELEAYADDDYASAGTVKKIVNSVISDISNIKNTLRGEFDSYREDFESRYGKLAGDVENYSRYVKDQESKKQENELINSISKLQEQYPELKTSKPVNDGLESSVISFSNAVADAMGSSLPAPGTGNYWPMVNKIVYAYSNGNPELNAIMAKNGIQPENYGITGSDVKNYGLVVNLDAMVRGEHIDPVTGKRNKRVNFLGNTVSSSDHVSAYREYLDSMGISQKQREKELAEAEIRGQQSLLKSESRRDVSPEIIGSDGSVSPDDVGKEMPKELAYEVVGRKYGQNTIDQEKMQALIWSGDKTGWDMFDVLNKAYRSLGLPEEKPDSDWPIRQKA